MRELVAGVYYLPLISANVYLIQGRQGFTLVDTGVKGAHRNIQQQLKAYGWSLSQIKRVIITHAHPDHMGSLPEVLKASQAEVWIHALDAPVLRGEKALADTLPKRSSLSPWDAVMGVLGGRGRPVAVQVDRELSKHELLPEVRDGVQVVHLPGHTAGQIGLFLTVERLLIGGDVMMNLPWGLTRPMRAFSSNWQQVNHSIGRVDSLRIKGLCLGHGPPILKHAEKQVAQLRRRCKS